MWSGVTTTLGANVEVLVLTGRLDGLQTIVPHATQDLDHLPIAIVTALQLAPDDGHGLWQDQCRLTSRNPIN